MDLKRRERLDSLSIAIDAPILQALQQMDRLDCKLLLVTKGDGQFVGLGSIGDIQLAIIRHGRLDMAIREVVRENIRLAKVGDSFESIKSIMLQFRTEFMPVIGADGELVDVHFWDEVFATLPPFRRQIQVPVVLMAGGKGTRLKPLSNVLPKALFPMGDKTITEVIIDRFMAAGCRQFLMSVNHKAEFIKSYFRQLDARDYTLEFFQEPIPLGTAGSLHLIKEKIQETFFVSNCDIIIDADYSEVIDYHNNHQNEITLVAALKHLKIPYGTLETAEGGQLVSMKEKPEFTHLINAGLYVMEPHLLEQIPVNEFFHVTDLVANVMGRGGNVGVFPVSEKSWSDIGQWKEYSQTLSRFASQ